MSESFRINQLPCPTWNRLHLNDAVISNPGQTLAVNTEVPTEFLALAEGVTHRSISRRTAETILSRTPEQGRERFVAGKQPIIGDQRFGTGLGKQFDDLLREKGGRIELLETAPGSRIEMPVLWHMDFHDGNRALSEQLIHVGEGSSLTLIMDYSSEKRDTGFAGISTKVILDRGASLTLCKVQMLGSRYLHFDDLGVSQEEESSMTLYQMELGSKDTYAGVRADLSGKRSSFTSRTAYFAKNDETRDISYNVIQRGRRTKSDMTFDGALSGKARKTFRGTIDFRNGSAGSVGDEQENVLLLSPDIVNKTIPLILCEEEDVQGRHGATIGRLADDMLFYLETRGIDRKAAQEMMVFARFGAVSREIPEEGLRKRVDEFIRAKFR